MQTTRSNCLFWALSMRRLLWHESWYFWARRTVQEKGDGTRGWWFHCGVSKSPPPDALSFVPTSEAQERLRNLPKWRRLIPPFRFEGYVKAGDP